MFSWSFASRRDHSASWYLTAIVVVLMLVVYGIVEGLYLMSIVSFLFAGVYLLMENNSTPIMQVDVTDRGIQVGGSFYDYTQFSRFAMISIADVPTFIRLYPIRKLAPLIDIPLSYDIDPVSLRTYLSSLIEEERNNTISNADALIHAMKL
ncbi:hypothetical protein H7169_01450 [Candidatus Gracilibacteria bacterium]|nr:hypothetical protein [Candidatus Gracilibacteria bacterium]